MNMDCRLFWIIHHIFPVLQKNKNESTIEYLFNPFNSISQLY